MKKKIRNRSIAETPSRTSLPLLKMSDSDITVPLARAAFRRAKLPGLSSGLLCSVLAVGAVWSPAPMSGQTQANEVSRELFSSRALQIQDDRPRVHDVAVSADYFFGQGDVTLPVFFALGQTLPGQFTPTVLKPDRESSYYGATISYSYRYKWYVDLSYQRGDSSGTTDLVYNPNFAALPSEFSIEDSWYQTYLRYNLSSGRLASYVRVGASFVQADLTDEVTLPQGAYRQDNETEDILGNIGFGLGYSVYAGRRFRAGLQVEVDGFFGQRSQTSTETLVNLNQPNTVELDNILYGGTARTTVRFEYRFGQGYLRAFLDGGVQGKFTIIDYSDEPNLDDDTYEELLWGPYVKLGLRYSF